jgi:hypothetical protein
MPQMGVVDVGGGARDVGCESAGEQLNFANRQIVLWSGCGGVWTRSSRRPMHRVLARDALQRDYNVFVQALDCAGQGQGGRWRGRGE